MKVKLCDVFDLQMGKTPSRDNLEYWNGEHKWVAIGDLGNTGKLSLKKIVMNISLSHICMVQKNENILRIRKAL